MPYAELSLASICDMQVQGLDTINLWRLTFSKALVSA